MLSKFRMKLQLDKIENKMLDELMDDNYNNMLKYFREYKQLSYDNIDKYFEQKEHING